MLTFIKIQAPILGRGKARLNFSKAYAKVAPDVRMSMLNQVLRQLRDEYAKAERDHRIARANEDARNAEAIRPAQAATS